MTKILGLAAIALFAYVSFVTMSRADSYERPRPSWNGSIVERPMGSDATVTTAYCGPYGDPNDCINR